MYKFEIWHPLIFLHMLISGFAISKTSIYKVCKFIRKYAFQVQKIKKDQSEASCYKHFYCLNLKSEFSFLFHQ